MNWEHTPQSAIEALASALLYLYLMALPHLLVVVASVPIVAVASSFDWSRIKQRLFKVSIFVLVLLISGAAGVFVWSTFVWGRFYYSTDYVFGYLPVVPITQSEIDAPFGGKTGALNGVSLAFINMLWALLSVGVWTGAAFASRSLWRALNRKAHALHTEL